MPEAPRSPFVAVVVAAALTACGPNCDRNPDEAPVRFTGGKTDVGRGVYESSPPGGPYLAFPPGRTYRFVHGLGRVPDDEDAWFSFDEYPFEGKDPGGAVPAAGNQATFEAVTAEYIDVRNDTCSDVKIRVTAEVHGETASGDGG